MFARLVRWGGLTAALAGAVFYVITGYMWVDLRVGNLLEFYADAGVLSTTITWDHPLLPSETAPISIRGASHASEGSGFYVCRGAQCWTFALSSRGAFVEFPIWVIPATGIFVAFLFGRAIKRKKDGLVCPHCGYSIVGLASPRCPECGSFVRRNP